MFDALIAAAISAATAAASAAAQHQAAKKAQRATQKAQQEATMRQMMAKKDVMEQTNRLINNLEPEKREEAQEDITDKLTEQYGAHAQEAQHISQQAATTQGDVSNDYTLAKAFADESVNADLSNTGRLWARINSAQRLRQDEAERFSRAAANIGLTQGSAQGWGNIDQGLIQKAGNKGSGLATAGSLIGALGAAAAPYAGKYLGSLDGLSSLSTPADASFWKGSSHLFK